MAAKNQNNGGLPPMSQGGPGGYQGGNSPNPPPADMIDDGVNPPRPAGTPPPQNSQLPQQPQGQQRDGAYAQPMQFGEQDRVSPPPMFAAPQVQERAVMGPQVDYSQYGPYTQEMTDEQLASSQLEGLLSSDSPYMRQAVLSGQRSAASRGALSSSISAGASQASAIQAAAPIAAQDAQAYRDMVSQNAAAINNNNLAKMQSATNMATSKLQSLTALASTAMDAESRGKVAALNANAQSAISQMEIQAQQEAQEFEAAHQRAMEMLGQEGRMDLAAFQQEGRMDLAAFQQEGAMDLERERQSGRMDLADVQNEYALEQIGFKGDVQSYITAQRIRGQYIIQANSDLSEILANIGLNSEMEAGQMLSAWTNAGSLHNSFLMPLPGLGAGTGGDGGG